jgi:hypothetical protein
MSRVDQADCRTRIAESSSASVAQWKVGAMAQIDFGTNIYRQSGQHRRRR